MVYNNAYDRSIKMKLMPSLQATPLEQIKALIQKSHLQGGYVELPPVDIDFLAPIIIPQGYKLNEDISKYELLLSADEHILKVVLEEQYGDGEIGLASRQDNPIILNARVRVIKASLIGTLFYNVVAMGFISKNHLYGNDDTCFSTELAIPINVVLGYTTYESTEEGSPFDEYVIYITKDEEFLITTTGEKIRRNNPLFFQILKEGTGNMSLQGNYTLTVAASPPPIC